MMFRRWTALLLVVALAFSCAGPAYALRASSEPATTGLEQALQASSGLEEGAITSEEAQGLVRGWAQLTQLQKADVLNELKQHGVTRGRYESLRALISADLPIGTGTFVSFPAWIDGRAGSADEARLLRLGADRAIRQRQGVIIAAAGEGSRLLNDAVQAGLLPAPPAGHSVLEYYSKPTVPVMPVTGKSSLQVQLETFSAEAAAYSVVGPVTIVIHEEAGRLVSALLKAHQNFGLASLTTVAQSMNPGFERSTGHLVLRDDGHVSFNPNGTGGVVQAAVRASTAAWQALGPGAQILLSYSDMLLDADTIQRMVGASAEHPFVGVGYPYPMERDPNRAADFRFKFGVPVLVNHGGHERIEMIEYKEWPTIAGLPDAVLAQEAQAKLAQPYQMLGNSGLYVLPLDGLSDRAAALDQQEHVQRGKEAIGVTGIKVEKVEKFATDLVALHDPAHMGFVAVDPEILAPIKDAAALRDVRALAARRERARAMALGVKPSRMQEQAQWEFHPARAREGRVTIGPDVSVPDPVGIYVASDRVIVYTQPQSDKPWQPFHPDHFYEAFQVTQPDDPIRIPAGTVFTKDGIRSAGMEEKVEAAKRLLADALAPIGSSDLSRSVQVLAPSILNRHRALYGLASQHPAIVLIPPSELPRFKTPASVATALLEQTPRWAKNVYVYGRADEVTAFHAALRPSHRSLAVTPVLWEPNRVDALTTLLQILAALGVARPSDGGRALLDALRTLARQV